MTAAEYFGNARRFDTAPAPEGMARARAAAKRDLESDFELLLRVAGGLNPWLREYRFAPPRWWRFDLAWRFD